MSFSNVCAEGELEMEYELRVVVEKVLVSTQEVVKRDTLKTYEVKPPESILESLNLSYFVARNIWRRSLPRRVAGASIACNDAYRFAACSRP